MRGDGGKAPSRGDSDLCLVRRRTRSLGTRTPDGEPVCSIAGVRDTEESRFVSSAASCHEMSDDAFCECAPVRAKRHSRFLGLVGRSVQGVESWCAWIDDSVPLQRPVMVNVPDRAPGWQSHEASGEGKPLVSNVLSSAMRVRTSSALERSCGAVRWVDPSELALFAMWHFGGSRIETLCLRVRSSVVHGLYPDQGDRVGRRHDRRSWSTLPMLNCEPIGDLDRSSC